MTDLAANIPGTAWDDFYRAVSELQRSVRVLTQDSAGVAEIEINAGVAEIEIKGNARLLCSRLCLEKTFANRATLSEGHAPWNAKEKADDHEFVFREYVFAFQGITFITRRRRD